MKGPDNLVASRIDRVLFPVTSRKASIAISVVIITLLSFILFSVRQNILTYDNTSETDLFHTDCSYRIWNWLLATFRICKANSTRQLLLLLLLLRTGSTIQRSPLISLLHIADSYSAICDARDHAICNI